MAAGRVAAAQLPNYIQLFAIGSGIIYAEPNTGSLTFNTVADMVAAPNLADQVNAICLGYTGRQVGFPVLSCRSSWRPVFISVCECVCDEPSSSWIPV